MQASKNHFEPKIAIFSFKSKNKGIIFGDLKIIKGMQIKMFNDIIKVVLKSIFFIIV